MRMRLRVVETMALACIAVQFVLPQRGIAPGIGSTSDAAQITTTARSIPHVVPRGRALRIHPHVLAGRSCGYVPDCTFQAPFGSVWSQPPGSPLYPCGPWCIDASQQIAHLIGANGLYDPNNGPSLMAPMNNPSGSFWFSLYYRGADPFGQFRDSAGHWISNFACIFMHTAPVGNGWNSCWIVTAVSLPANAQIVFWVLNQGGGDGYPFDIALPCVAPDSSYCPSMSILNQYSPPAGPGTAELLGGGSPSEHHCSCNNADPISTAIGNFWHTFPDLAVPGRGLSLAFARTYNSLAASQDGPLGFGWTEPYSMFLTTDSSNAITVHEEGSSAVTFTPSGGAYQAPARVLATLSSSLDGNTFTFTRQDQDQYVFSAPSLSAAGLLLKEVDRNGYATTLSYFSFR